MKSGRRASVRAIVHPLPAGLDNRKTKPYWQGARAETIVTLRTELYAKEKAAKLASKAGKGARRGQKVRGGALRRPGGQV